MLHTGKSSTKSTVNYHPEIAKHFQTCQGKDAEQDVESKTPTYPCISNYYQQL